VALSSDESLRAGREAFERHDWQAAYDILSEADRQGGLPADGLHLLAQAAWFAAQPDATVEALERAHDAYLKAGDRSSAAMMAFRVAEQHGMRGSMAPAGGWAARAERLIEDDPDSPVHGWLSWMRGLVSWVQGDIPGAAAHYDRALEVAARAQDRSLYGMTLHDKGHALCIGGKVREGLALMDEAMAEVVGGEMQPMAAGYVYCGMISACSRLGDYARASDWTDATTRWCERHSITGFPGVCRIHRAELLRIHGSWPQAEEEARRACEELPQFNLFSGLGPAFLEIAEVRRVMGDLTGAEEAYGRAHEHGASPQPGLSLVRLAEGKIGAAAAGVAQALAATAEPLPRVGLLAAQADIALAGGDLATASAAADELDSIVIGYESTGHRATAARARGAVMLAHGDAEGALPLLRRAREQWQALDAPYEVAEARVLLGRAYQAMGDVEAAVLELKAARATFERLGAPLPAEVTAELLAALAPAAEAAERVRRAFMFTDIEKSTDLVSAIGDEAWEDLLAWHDQTLRQLFASHRGEVVHHTGDGFFVAFENATSALRAAVAVQRALAEHRRSHGFAPRVRIGVHCAEATRRGRDYSGGEVHKAARIAAAATGGEILASRETIDETPGGFTTSEPREIVAKGIPDPVRVLRVDWRT
jgi:class 3 adenylate cyclase